MCHLDRPAMSLVYELDRVMCRVMTSDAPGQVNALKFALHIREDMRTETKYFLLLLTSKVARANSAGS